MRKIPKVQIIYMLIGMIIGHGILLQCLFNFVDITAPWWWWMIAAVLLDLLVCK